MKHLQSMISGWSYCSCWVYFVLGRLLLVLTCHDVDTYAFVVTPSSPTSRSVERTRWIVPPNRHARLQTTAESSSTHRKAVAKAAAIATAATKIGKGGSNSILRGKLGVFVSKFLISPRRALEVGKSIGLHILQDWGDLALISMFIAAPFPLAKWVYRKRHPSYEAEQLERHFLKSKTRRLARVATEVGQLLGLIYAVEVGILLLKELGFQFVKIYPINQWTAGIVFSLWGAQNISAIKYWIISRGNRRDIQNMGGVPRLLNRFFDVLIYAGTVLAILDFLSVETGFALKSVFGLGSVGTLVFSLASKELVAEFLASLAIQGTNMYQEGDEILLADGTQGIVQRMGWLNTHIRRGDELIVRIPNSQLSGMRLANVSRVRLSQVKQTLAIRYEDIKKLPKLCEDIKAEIRASCPTLIEDEGFRPFRVHWREYHKYYLEVVVDAHFRTRPFCDAYFEVRQEVLQAIARATKKNGVLFSYTNFLNSGVPVTAFENL